MGLQFVILLTQLEFSTDDMVEESNIMPAENKTELDGAATEPSSGRFGKPVETPSLAEDVKGMCRRWE